jgi:hypothetical protein
MVFIGNKSQTVDSSLQQKRGAGQSAINLGCSLLRTCRNNRVLLHRKIEIQILNCESFIRFWGIFFVEEKFNGISSLKGGGLNWPILLFKTLYQLIKQNLNKCSCHLQNKFSVL